jgi:type IV pilus assembly protein PilW
MDSAKPRPLARARGFSLVELMVALVIASLLLVALTVMFVNTSNARNELDKSSRQIETGRYAMQVLADELRHAGFYGPLSNAPTTTLTALPDACSSALSDIRGGLAIPVQGYAGAANAAALDGGNLACINAAAGYKPNTAVLVIRRVDTTLSAGIATAGYFNMQVSGCAGDATRYVLDTDTATTYTLHSNGAPGCTPITGAPAAKITPFYHRIFYISTCSGVDCTASGADAVPTLKRIDMTPTGAAAPKAIVDGIENLQIDYGIDTTATPGDGSPDVYKTAPLTFAEWQNVMAVRVHLLARNVETSPAFTETKTFVLGAVSVSPTDSYRRHAYSELVRLNNPAGRRE